MSAKPLMLHLSEGGIDHHDQTTPGFLRKFQQDYEVRTISLQNRGLARMITEIFLLLLFSKRARLIFTSSYWLTFAVMLFQVLTFSRASHISVSLNLSRRPLKFGNRLVNALVNQMFNRLDLVIVHSMHEVDLFHGLHAIPREKFVFVHWGYDLPAFDSTRFDDHPSPYFCMIGRNNRDRTTFLEAMRDLPAQGVLIGPAYAPVDPATVPENVDVLYDIPSSDCLNCIANSCANLILVNDENSGAGHITAVHTMHLGIPQIVSDAMPLREYFSDGFNALMVPIGDVGAVRAAMLSLLGDPTRRAELTGNGRVVAEQWLNTAFTESRLQDIVQSFITNRPIDFIDATWKRWHDNLE